MHIVSPEAHAELISCCASSQAHSVEQLNKKNMQPACDMVQHHGVEYSEMLDIAGGAGMVRARGSDHDSLALLGCHLGFSPDLPARFLLSQSWKQTQVFGGCCTVQVLV